MDDSTVQIAFKGVDDVSSAAAAVSKSVGNVGDAAKASGPSWLSMASAVAMGQAAFSALKGAADDVFGFLKESMTVANASANSIAQINNSVQNLGKSAPITTEAAEQLADKMSSMYTASKDTVLATEQVALKFSSISKNEYPQFIQLTEDMSAKMGIDMPSAAQILGKAMQNPAMATKALASAGVTLTSSMKAVLTQAQKTGDVQQAQTLIMDALNQSMGGAAAAAAATNSGKIQLLQNDYQNLQDKVGTALQVAIQPFIAKLSAWASSDQAQATIQKIVTGFGNMITTVGNFVTNTLIPMAEKYWPYLKSALETVIASIMEAISWFKQHEQTVKDVIVVVASLVIAFKTISTVIGIVKNVTGVFNDLKVAFNLVKVAASGLFDFLLANPFVLIIAAVAIAAYEIITHWTQVKDFTEKIWGDIKSLFMKFLPEIVLIILGPIAFVVLEIVRHWTEISEETSRLWGDIKDFFSSMWGDIKSIFSKGVSDVTTFFMDLPHNILVGIGMMAGYIYDFFTVTVPDAWNSFIAWCEKIPGEISNVAQSAWKGFTDWITKLWTDSLTDTVNGYNAVIKWFSDLPGEILNFAQSMWHNLTTTLTNMWNDGVKIVENMYNGIIKYFTDMPGQVSTSVNSMWSSVKSGFDSFYNNAIAWAKQTVDDIVKFFTDIPGEIEGALKGAVKSAEGSLGNIGSAISSGFNSVVNGHADGGIIYASSGFSPQGTDTVPAMLTPGEMVLNSSQQSSLWNMANGQGGSGGVTVVIQGGVFLDNNTVNKLAQAVQTAVGRNTQWVRNGAF